MSSLSLELILLLFAAIALSLSAGFYVWLASLALLCSSGCDTMQSTSNEVGDIFADGSMTECKNLGNSSYPAGRWTQVDWPRRRHWGFTTDWENSRVESGHYTTRARTRAVSTIGHEDEGGTGSSNQTTLPPLWGDERDIEASPLTKRPQELNQAT